jgi:hypothetical protein
LGLFEARRHAAALCQPFGVWGDPPNRPWQHGKWRPCRAAATEPNVRVACSRRQHMRRGIGRGGDQGFIAGHGHLRVRLRRTTVSVEVIRLVLMTVSPLMAAAERTASTPREELPQRGAGTRHDRGGPIRPQRLPSAHAGGVEPAAARGRTWMTTDTPASTEAKAAVAGGRADNRP